MRSLLKKNPRGLGPTLGGPTLHPGSGILVLTSTHKDKTKQQQKQYTGWQMRQSPCWPKSRDSSRVSLRGTCKNRMRDGPLGGGAPSKVVINIQETSPRRFWMQQKAALEEGKIQTDSRQVGRVQSREGHEWQARCTLQPVGKRELLRGWQGGQESF